MVAVAVNAVTGDLCVEPGAFLQTRCERFVTRQATLLGHLLACSVALGAVRQTFQVRVGFGEITR